mgnify:CR=1 FL=1
MSELPAEPIDLTPLHAVLQRYAPQGRGGLLPALLDMALVAFGVIALSAVLSRTGSVLLGCWCFFLVQALFVAIPRTPGADSASVPPDDGFQRAHMAAQAALSRLIGQ